MASDKRELAANILVGQLGRKYVELMTCLASEFVKFVQPSDVQLEGRLDDVMQFGV